MRRYAATDHAHDILANLILELDPDPRRHLHDAHQPERRAGDPRCDVTLTRRETIESRIAFGSRAPTGQLVVVVDPRTDQLHVDLAKCGIVSSTGNLRPRGLERVTVGLGSPGLNPLADCRVGLGGPRGGVGERRAAALELLAAPTRAGRIPRRHAHHLDATTHPGWTRRPDAPDASASARGASGPGPRRSPSDVQPDTHDCATAVELGATRAASPCATR